MKPLILLGILFLVSTIAPAQTSKCEAKIVIYDGASPLFPKGWRKGKIKAIANAPEHLKLAEDTIAIRSAISKYPANLIKDEIRQIYLVGKLRISGVYFSGTIAENVLYIASKSNTDIEKTFHHEFSSILLRNHAPHSLETRWKLLSPGLLNCSSSSAVKDGYFSLAKNASLLERGYLTSYSLSNWENDFNIYAENIFSGDPFFWRLVDHYPLIKQKAKLVMHFYGQIHPLFTENYFRLLFNDNSAMITLGNHRQN